MMYSVWNHGRREYEYYATPERSEAVNAPTPRHIQGGELGAAPETAAWPLPSNAQPVGRGKYPKGFIASRASGGLGLIPDLTPTNVVVWGALGYVAYRFLQKKGYI